MNGSVGEFVTTGYTLVMLAQRFYQSWLCPVMLAHLSKFVNAVYTWLLVDFTLMIILVTL
jgi:hypothetical protein